MFFSNMINCACQEESIYFLDKCYVVATATSGGLDNMEAYWNLPVCCYNPLTPV